MEKGREMEKRREIQKGRENGGVWKFCGNLGENKKIRLLAA